MQTVFFKKTSLKNRHAERSDPDMREEHPILPAIDKVRTGIRIRLLMRSRGLSVQDIRRSLCLGCVQGIYHWLDGTSLPTIDNLYALSHIFGVPMDWIICGNRDRTERETEYFGWLPNDPASWKKRAVMYYFLVSQGDAA